MRLAYLNKADSATLTASTSAGSLVVDNLKNIYKSKVWRSTAKTATITAQWNTAVISSVLVLPFSSLSSAATVRIRCYINASDVSPSYDSGFVVAIPPKPITEFPWGEVPIGVNGYSYGNSSMMVKYFPVNSYQKIVIDLDDTFGTLDYIEIGRLFISNYYEFKTNADFGLSKTTVDTSETYRNEASDLLTERGIMYQVMKLSLSSMRTADREFVYGVVSKATVRQPVFVSIFPENEDSQLEQEYQIYGKIGSQNSISILNINRFSSELELESV